MGNISNMRTTKCFQTDKDCIFEVSLKINKLRNVIAAFIAIIRNLLQQKNLFELHCSVVVCKKMFL